MSEAKVPFQERGFFKALITLGGKMSTQRHLSAISKGMMSSMPLLLVGAIFQIICIIPLDIIQKNTETLMIPYNMTMGIFSIVVAFAIAYNLANSYKMKGMMNGVTALVVFLMTVAPSVNVATAEVNAQGQNVIFNGLPTSFLGGQGLFVAMIIAIACVEITRFCQVKNIVIKMPDVVPPSLGEAFTAILPMLFSTIVFFGLNLILQSTVQMNLAEGIMAIMAIPLQAVNSIGGMLFVIVFACVLWCFGIHGTIIVYPFVMPMMIMAAESNAALVAQGMPAEFWPSMLFGAVALVGGTGNTMGLTLLGLRSKSKQIKAISTASVVPGWCGINEPMSFGMPIVFNPVLMIPYVLSSVVIFFLMWGAYALGIMKPTYIAMQTLMPIGISSFIGSGMHWGNLIFHYAMIAVSGLIYYPFYKVYEAQLVKREKEIEEKEGAGAVAE